MKTHLKTHLKLKNTFEMKIDYYSAHMDHRAKSQVK